MNTSVLFSSASEEWATPADVYASLDAEFHFDFDPCPLGGTEDGTAPLFVEWRKKRVYCNPPYGPGIRPFLERALEADVAVFLIPARTDTRWMHEIVLPYAKEIRFIKGRLKFGGAENSAPFPSMIVIFERDRCGWMREGGDMQCIWEAGHDGICEWGPLPTWTHTNEEDNSDYEEGL